MIDLKLIVKNIEARRLCEMKEQETIEEIDENITSSTLFRYKGLSALTKAKLDAITYYRRLLKNSCMHTDVSKNGDESIYLQYEEPINIHSEYVKGYEYCLACGTTWGMGVFQRGTYRSERKIFDINPYLDFTSLELFQQSLNDVIERIEDIIIELGKRKDDIEYVVLMAILKQELEKSQERSRKK